MVYIREIKTRDYWIRLRTDGIIETRAIESENMRHDVEEAKVVIAAVLEISEGKKYPLLNVLGDIYVTEAAQKYYQSQPPAACASAMIVKTFAQRLIGNFFLNYRKLPIPTKLFESEEMAIKWLEEYKIKS